MKIFLKIIAWVGFGIFSLGTVIALMQTVSYMVHPPGPYSGGVNFGHPIAFTLAIIGIPLMLIGGLLARPKYFWLVSIIVSSFYIVAFLPSIEDFVSKIQQTEREWLFRQGWILRVALQDIGPLVLGVIGVVEGVLVRRTEIKIKANVKQVETSIKD